MYLVGVSVRRVEDITEVLWGTKSKPDDKGVVKDTIPDAEILNVDLDEDSMSEPLTDTGFLTKNKKRKKRQR